MYDGYLSLITFGLFFVIVSNVHSLFASILIRSAFGPTVLYTEDYFSKAVEKFGTILGLIPVGLSDVARNVSFSYTVVMLGGSVLMELLLTEPTINETSEPDIIKLCRINKYANLRATNITSV